MRLARRLSSLLSLLLLLSTALLLRGCLQAEESDLVRYDPQRDEFRALMIQRGITGDQNDLPYLKAFFQNRDHLLMPVLSISVPLLDVRLLRLSDTTFAFTPFSNAPNNLDPHTSPVSLNAITITPGTFFVEDHTLCYYHAITVPGKIIDGALEQISIAAQNDDEVKPLNEELLRRQQGGQRRTWDDLVADAIHSLDQTGQPPAATEAASQPGDDKNNPLACFDDESLHHLITALTAKSLRIKRDGPTFSATFPLSAADSQAVAAAYQKIAKHLHELAAAKPDVKDLQLQNAIAGATTIVAGNDGATLTIDPVRLSNLAPQLAPLPAPGTGDDAQKTRNSRADTLQFVRDQKLPLDETLTSQQILADFAANKLRAYPSTPPLTPGTGMVNPSTTTAP
jgi:hypothetical protein